MSLVVIEKPSVELLIVLRRSWRLLFDDSEDVVLANDQVLFAFEHHVVAVVLAEQHPVADLHFGFAQRAVLEDLAVANGEHFALDRLLLRRVRDDDPSRALFFFLHTSDHDAVLKRANLVHGRASSRLKNPARHPCRRSRRELREMRIRPDSAAKALES